MTNRGGKSSFFEKAGKSFLKRVGDPQAGIPSRSNKTSPREEMFDFEPFSKSLHYEAYDEETGIFINTNSLGFVIEAIPLMGADDSVQKEITSIFQELMEEGSSVQCLLFADPRVEAFLNKWKAPRKDHGGIYAELASNRAEFFEEQVKTCDSLPPRTFRFILSYSVPIKGDLNPAYLATLRDLKQRMLRTLSGLTHAFAWGPKDLLQTLDGLINLQCSPETPTRKWNPYETLSSQLTQGGTMHTFEDHLEWDIEKTIHFKSYRATDYPEMWSLNGMQRLIGDLYRESFRIHFPFFIHYGVHCPDQAKETAAFTRRMHLVENQGRSSALRKFIPELEQELNEMDYVRRQINQSDRLVLTQLGVGLWGNPQEFPQAEQTLKSLFRVNQFRLTENKYIHLPQYLSFLPMAWAEYIDDLKKLDLLKTSISLETGNLVPIQGEWWGTPSPGILLQGRRGQLFQWNPFDNRNGNYNIVVVGRSGSGKSVFMQELLMSSLGTGARVFVLDVGRSFEKMCSLTEGQYIEFSNQTPLCLNPFTHIPTDDSEERDSALNMLKSVLSAMAAPISGTSDYENALLEKAVRAAWDEKKNRATVTTVAEWLQSQNDERAQSLGVMLTPYTKKGVYGKYFEGKNNVDFTKPMVLIELEELKEKKDLQAVVLQMFIMTITNQTFLGDRKTPFHICIDEAWDLLRGKQTGVFIETLARRLRKYNGSLVVGTQSVDDFYATPGALAAFENSDWMCLLAQKKSSIHRFKQSGRIDLDQEKEAVLESITTRHGDFSEVMICDPEGFYAVGRLRLDPFSILLYSTKADEYAKIKELQNKGLSISEAINQILNSNGSRYNADTDNKNI